MGLMSLANTRVVDQVLTGLAHGYSNNNYIGKRLAPPVPVQEYGGVTIAFDRSTVIEDSYGRAPGGEFKTVHKTWDGNPYKLKNKGLKFPVPIEHQTDTERLGFEWNLIANDDMMERLMLEHEIETAGIFTNTTKYIASNRATLSGTSQWSDPASTPKADIRAAKTAIKLSAGAKSNSTALALWMGEDVMNALQEHPDILAIREGHSDRPITGDLLADYFGIDRVIVGDAVKQSSAGASAEFVWGKFAGLCAVNRAGIDGTTIAPQGNINRFTPSFAYTYTMESDGVVHPYQYEVVWNSDRDCWEYKSRYDRVVVETGIESGYLWSAAVA